MSNDRERCHCRRKSCWRALLWIPKEFQWRSKAAPFPGHLNYDRGIQLMINCTKDEQNKTGVQDKGTRRQAHGSLRFWLVLPGPSISFAWPRRAASSVRRAACDRQQARTRREGWRAETGRAGREQQQRRVGASLALRGSHLKAPRSSAFPLKGSATCLHTRLLHKQKQNPLEKR